MRTESVHFLPSTGAPELPVAQWMCCAPGTAGESAGAWPLVAAGSRSCLRRSAQQQKGAAQRYLSLEPGPG